MTTSLVKRNGQFIGVGAFIQPGETLREEPPERSMLHELLRRKAAEISRYRVSGLLSPSECELVEALWGGMSLRAFAQQEGIKPGSVEYLIHRLRTRAPRFYRWWRLKNWNRRRC